MGEAVGAASQAVLWRNYILRCAQRDESALAALYDESSRLVYTMALRILRDEADASEVVVDVYRQVWEMAHRFDEQRGSAAAWLVILARSRAMDRRRYRNSRTRHETPPAELPDAVSPGPDPEGLAMSRQTGRTVTRALEAVPQEQREVIELAFFSGMSHAEIAERLGQPLGTVKTRIRLGVVKLRDLLRDTV